MLSYLPKYPGAQIRHAFSSVVAYIVPAPLIATHDKHEEWQGKQGVAIYGFYIGSK